MDKAAAIDQVAAELNGPSADVRLAILNAIAAQDTNPGFYFWECGQGVLPSAKAEAAVIA